MKFKEDKLILFRNDMPKHHVSLNIENITINHFKSSCINHIENSSIVLFVDNNGLTKEIKNRYV